jgi:hypothetical protein
MQATSYEHLIGSARRRARLEATHPTKAIAKALGVTPAGLRYLAKLAATGQSHQRGNEATKLSAQGYVESVRCDNGRLPGEMAFRQWHEWRATDAGREIVRRAREMGW